MPEVTGTVTDSVRNTSYIVKLAGPPATEVFAFNMRQIYNSKEGLHLTEVPTLLCPSISGDTDDAKKGKYILADLFLQDSRCKDGDRLCPETDISFVKQALLQPFPSRTMIAKAYLTNGELMMEPANQGQIVSKKEELKYPISLIEIGEIDDLETPIGLTLMREKQKLANRSKSDSREAEDDKRTDKSSAEDMDDTASTIITGTLNQGPRSASNRINRPENEADRASPSVLDPDFAPWMASTGSTPPSKRQGPTSTDVSDATDSGDSPSRPRSGSPTITGKPPTSPRKRGKITRRMRKSPDKSYRQPTIRGFLTPSPPKSPPPSPVGNRTPLPQRRNKRRSQRMESEGAIWPAAKRVNAGSSSPDSLDYFPKDIGDSLKDDDMDLNDLPRASVVDTTVEEIIIDDQEVGVPSTEKAPSDDPGQTMVDLSNDLTPETVEAARHHPDASQGTSHTGRGTNAPFMPTPPSSQTSSSSNSTAAHKGRSESKEISPTPGTSGVPTIHSNLSPKRDVTFHTNMNMATRKRPRHVLIKAIDDKLCVKILTFEAYNIEDIVRCFFQENYETDDPGASFDETFQQLVDSSADNSPDTSVISTIETFDNTTVQTFVKTEPSQEDETTIDHSVICIDDSQDETMMNQAKDDDDQTQAMMTQDDGRSSIKKEKDQEGENGSKEEDGEEKENEDYAN